MEAPRIPALLSDQPHPAGTTTLVGGRVFDGGGVTTEGAITIEGGSISSIGGSPPSGARVVDVAGRTVMPGLIDAHAHLSMLEHASDGVGLRKGQEPVRSHAGDHLVARNLRRALEYGVTTIRDVGAYGDVLLEIRQAIRLGAFPAPRLLVCGRIVSATAPGGRFFPGMYREADGPDEMRKAVREQIRAGADFVKIMSTGARSVELENPLPSQVTEYEMAAFVDEAHRQGYRTAAHCEGIHGTELAVRAGCDTVEHGFHLHQRPDLLEHMRDHGQTLVPTIDFLHHVSESGAWSGVLEEQGHGNVEAADATLRAAREIGVRLALGSDSPLPSGSGVELTRMIEHGLSPLEALTAATSGSAAALGLDHLVGRIQPGLLADVVVVDGDPTEHPDLLTDPANIWLVLRNGVPVAGTRLAPPPFD